MSSENRSEKPTPKKRRESRRKGEMARSKEVAPTLVYMSVLFFFFIGSPYLLKEMRAVARSLWLESLYGDIDLNSAVGLIRQCLLGAARVVGPLLALAVAASLVGSLGQGLVLSSHRLKIKADSLNPARNVKRIFSSRGLMEALKATALLLTIGYIGTSVLMESWDILRGIVFLEVPGILIALGQILYTICFRIGILLVVVAAIDYLFQRFQHEKSLKQTKQEVREDLKDIEGNPLIKGRIRSLQREMARRRMMEDVKTADMVITNPTEYAVAIKYDLSNMSAPKVVAKGRAHLAARIKEVARQYNVATVENVTLAQALYKSVEIGQEIPAALYKAVAQILAYVYRLRETRWH